MYVGLKQPRGDGERYVTPAQAAAKETTFSGEFDPKWGPPGGAFDFPVKTSVSGLRKNSLLQHGSLLLSIPRGFFLAVVVVLSVFYSYIVEYVFV